MANYINVTLDTIEPSSVVVLINGDETKTTSSAVTLTIDCADADLSEYQMKIWGTADAPTESDAIWETYQHTKNVTLPSGDGLKTVYVKMRDDVWNENSLPAYDSITLYEKVPSIVSFSVTSSRISLVNGKNIISGAFYADENVDAVKLMIVDNVNARHDSPSNIAIPKNAGSELYDDNNEATESEAVLELEGRVNKEIGFNYTIHASDIVAVAPGDGVKILKAFVRSAETGSWSV